MFLQAAPPSEASCSKECVRVIESCDELDSYLDSVSPESLVVLVGAKQQASGRSAAATVAALLQQHLITCASTWTCRRMHAAAHQGSREGCPPCPSIPAAGGSRQYRHFHRNSLPVHAPLHSQGHCIPRSTRHTQCCATCAVPPWHHTPAAAVELSLLTMHVIHGSTPPTTAVPLVHS